MEWLEVTFYRIKRSITNLIVWFPTIWNDRHWDHCYIFKILKKKLELHAYSFIYNYGTYEVTEAKQMLLCVSYLERLIREPYHDIAFKKHYEKWGKPKISIDDDGFLRIKYPNVITDDDEKLESGEFRHASKYERQLYNQDLENLISIIRDHIFEWWD